MLHLLNHIQKYILLDRLNLLIDIKNQKHLGRYKVRILLDADSDYGYYMYM